RVRGGTARRCSGVRHGLATSRPLFPDFASRNPGYLLAGGLVQLLQLPSPLQMSLGRAPVAEIASRSFLMMMTDRLSSGAGYAATREAAMAAFAKAGGENDR